MMMKENYKNSTSTQSMILIKCHCFDFNALQNLTNKKTRYLKYVTILLK